MGRLGKDPEVKTFDNGNQIAIFSLATSEYWKDKNTGEKKSKTEWHNVVVSGGASKVVGEYVKKGDLLMVEGKLTTRSWEKDGQTNYITEVICREVTLMPKGSSENKTTEKKPTSLVEQCEDVDDDLPF